jgi:alpha-L-rhamnosidase
LWEQWNGTESRNHIMFGDILAWFYKALAGINPDPAAPAFKHFVIKPNVVGDLTSAEASYNSVRGRIASDWKVEKGRLDLEITVPVNTMATVYVPAADPATVKEGGEPAAEAEGVKVVEAKGGCAVYEVGSGSYRFTAPR